jgi:hypothetical protein
MQGPPTIPFRLSEVCRDFQVHLASEYPAADQKRISTCFAGKNVVQHNVTGSYFLESDMFPSACRGMDATGPAAPLHEQAEWLRTMLQSITRPRTQQLEVVKFIIPVPRVLTNDDVFSAAMDEAFHTATTWYYRCGIMLSLLCQDVVAAPRWMCVATLSKFLQQRIAPTFQSPTRDIVSPCINCLYISQDIVGSSLCSRTQYDVHHMYDVEGVNAFLSNIVAITSPPLSSDLEQDIAVMHPDYPCAKPTTLCDGRKDQCHASVYQDHMGVNILCPLSSDELLTAYSIPGNLQNAYSCSTAGHRNVNLRATACVPWRMADILIEPALIFLLCSHHDPEDTHPMPRTFSTLVSVSIPSIDEWAAAYQASAYCKAIIAKFPEPWNAK